MVREEGPIFLAFFRKENSPEKSQLFIHLIDNWCCLVILSIIQNIQLKQKKNYYNLIILLYETY